MCHSSIILLRREPRDIINHVWRRRQYWHGASSYRQREPELVGMGASSSLPSGEAINGRREAARLFPPVLCRPKDRFSSSNQLHSQSQNMFVKTLIFLAAAATLALADHEVCDWTLFMSTMERLG